jgi:excisionase family DNA binding protein
MREVAVLTVNQAGLYCQVSPQAIVNWINTGKLKAYKTAGGHRRIVKSEMDEFLKRHNMPAFGNYFYPYESHQARLTGKEGLPNGSRSQC